MCDELLVNVSGVGKHFGRRVVLEDINFDLPRGEGICVFGANAAGKSTLVRVIAGLVRPTTGKVKICGRSVGAADAESGRLVGAVLHESMIYSQLTVRENLLFFARLYGVKEREKRVNEVLKEWELSKYRYDYAVRLSAGMRRRLTFARATVHEPKILLADEPFSNLDSRGCELVSDFLSGFRKRGGVAVLTTHHSDLGLGCSSRAAVLDGCRFVFNRKVSEVDSERFVRDYLSYARAES